MSWCLGSTRAIRRAEEEGGHGVAGQRISSPGGQRCDRKKEPLPGPCSPSSRSRTVAPSVPPSSGARSIVEPSDRARIVCWIVDRATPTPHPPARVKSLVAYVGVPTRDLEDVMQEAMVRLWERREQARSAGNPGAFRDSVVLNTARDHRRGARRREEALTGFDEAALRDERPSPEEHAIARQEAALVRELIDQIGERHRGVFIACELLERPIAEVAREQEIPLETARSRLRRAWEEFDEAAARWVSRQRGRGARRLRAVLFPPWLFAQRWPWRDGPTRSMVEGMVIAFAAVLAVLVASHAQPAGPVQSPMAARISTAIAPPSAQAASEPAEATPMSARPARRETERP